MSLKATNTRELCFSWLAINTLHAEKSNTLPKIFAILCIVVAAAAVTVIYPLTFCVATQLRSTRNIPIFLKYAPDTNQLVIHFFDFFVHCLATIFSFVSFERMPYAECWCHRLRLQAGRMQQAAERNNKFWIETNKPMSITHNHRIVTKIFSEMAAIWMKKKWREKNWRNWAARKNLTEKHFSVQLSVHGKSK